MTVPAGWREMAHAAVPPLPEAAAQDFEPGECKRGWQRLAAGTREHYFRSNVLLPRLPKERIRRF